VLACAPGSGRAPAIPDPDASAMEPRVRAAIADARRAVTAQPRLAPAWGHLGAVFDVHGLYPEAVACYRRARELDPAEFAWAYLLAIVRDVDGAGTDEVEALFAAAAQLAPDYPQVWFRMGHARSLRGDLARAADAFRRAIQLDPRFGPAHRGLGQVLLAAGHPDQALAPLGVAAELLPEDGSTMSSIVQALRHSGQAVQAREVAARAAGLSAQQAIADPVVAREVTAHGASSAHLMDRAESLLARGDHAAAARLLEAVLETRPAEAHVHYALGVALAGTGREDEAQSLQRRALGLDPAHVAAHVELARLLERQVRLDEALQVCRRAHAVAPLDPAVLATLARLLLRSGDDRGAIEVYEDLAGLAPLEPLELSNWGNALLREGRPEQAIERYREALRLDPVHANAHHNWGLALERTGRTGEALEHYRAAIAIDPSHPARERIEQLRSRPDR
jgi:tetratricopeptide (TPR) repeat protein